jgi:uncharacterized protein YlbG (UPF0298 family)
MDRIRQNQVFLKAILQSSSKRYKTLVLNCSEENLKGLVECIINYDRFVISKQIRRIRASHVSSLLRYFKKRSELQETKLRKLLLKHHPSVKLLLQRALSTIIEESLLCVYGS